MPIPRWKFLSACKDGDIDLVRKYIEMANHRAYLQDDSALNSAVCYNHPDILSVLLDAGMDPNIHGEHVPALHVAAANDNVEAAKILISHGAKIDARDNVNNDTALIYGIRDGKFRVAELLLDAGADPNLIDRRGFAPLHIAAIRNDTKLVRCLLDHNAAINARTQRDGRTPLMIAAAAGFEEMVEMLLSSGADPSIVDSGGKSPLERAVECHRSDVVKILEKTGSPPKPPSAVANGEAYNNRGLAYRSLGKSAEAIANFSKAIEIDPRYGEAYNNRGSAYASLGNYVQAIADFSRAIGSDPKYGDAYHNRGSAHANLGNYAQAIADFTRAIEIDPRYAETYTNRGLAYLRLGKSAEAITDFNRAIEIDPRYAEAYNNRGLAHIDLADYLQAITDFNRAIEINLKFGEAYNNRGLAYANLGNHEHEIADRRTAARLGHEGAKNFLRSKGIDW